MTSMQLVPFTRFLQKASNLLGFAGNSLSAQQRTPPPIDGEIVYSKNNVCIHQPSSSGVKQIPGYFTLRCQSDDVCGTTLVLTWVPNRTIKSNPRSLHGSPQLDTPDRPACNSYGSNGSKSPNGSGQPSAGPANTTAEHVASVGSRQCFKNVGSSEESLLAAAMSASEVPAVQRLMKNATLAGEKHTSFAQSESQFLGQAAGCAMVRPHTLALIDGDMQTLLPTADTELQSSLLTPSSSSTGLSSLEASTAFETADSSRLSSLNISPADNVSTSSFLLGINEMIAGKSELTFYDSPQAAGNRKHQLPVFCVDLGLMKSLRIFYSNDECTCGQLLVASRESQYKIFHFYYGGLDKLAEVLNEWNLFNEAKMKHKLPSSQSKLFQVVRPKLPDGQGHPEEGYHSLVTAAAWKCHMNDHGQICDELTLRRDIFFGGLDPALRGQVWPFLLDYYPFESTYEEREYIRSQRHMEYYNSISKIREAMSLDERERFWRMTQNIVEKDVVRTDRLNPYYAGDDNPNVEVLKQLLLNYAAAHPKLGYAQGMSDLLAPLLSELHVEADVYWCFVGLMERTIFVSSPRDVDMDKQLMYLKGLFRLVVPKFYSHLQKVGEALGLLFVHRWILLCFKREFQECDAMSIWEACWTRYQTEYFHLFICAAVVALYGDDVVHSQLPADEMLLHFGSLSMHMNCRIVLKKARGLLHQFRLLETIPCTLMGLCTLSGAGMWDSGHVPAVECVGNHGAEGCPNIGSHFN